MVTTAICGSLMFIRGRKLTNGNIIVEAYEQTEVFEIKP